MKSKLLLLAMVGFVFAGTLFAQVLDKPLAIVKLTKTEQIGAKQFQKYVDTLQKSLGSAIAPAQLKNLLERRVDSLLLNQAAERDKVTVADSEVAATIAQQRAALGAQVTEDMFKRLISQQTSMTWDEFVQSVKDRLVQERYLYQKKPQLQGAKYQATEDEIKNIYEQDAAKFVAPSMSRFSFIYVDTRNKDASQKQALKQKMDEFSRQIRAGGKAVFEDLVKKSLDDATYTGGDFGYIVKGDPQTTQALGKNFVDAIFDLNANEFSPVTESNLGYYIVQITDKRSPRLLNLDDPLLPGQKLTVREQIRQYVVAQKQTKAVATALEELLKDIRKQADVTYFEQNFTW